MGERYKIGGMCLGTPKLLNNDGSYSNINRSFPSFWSIRGLHLQNAYVDVWMVSEPCPSAGGKQGRTSGRSRQRNRQKDRNLANRGARNFR